MAAVLRPIVLVQPTDEKAKARKMPRSAGQSGLQQVGAGDCVLSVSIWTSSGTSSAQSATQLAPQTAAQLCWYVSKLWTAPILRAVGLLVSFRGCCIYGPDFCRSKKWLSFPGWTPRPLIGFEVRNRAEADRRTPQGASSSGQGAHRLLYR